MYNKQKYFNPDTIGTKYWKFFVWPQIGVISWPKDFSAGAFENWVIETIGLRSALSFIIGTKCSLEMSFSYENLYSLPRLKFRIGNVFDLLSIVENCKFFLHFQMHKKQPRATRSRKSWVKSLFLTKVLKNQLAFQLKQSLNFLTSIYAKFCMNPGKPAIVTTLYLQPNKLGKCKKKK